MRLWAATGSDLGCSLTPLPWNKIITQTTHIQRLHSGYITRSDRSVRERFLIFKNSSSITWLCVQRLCIKTETLTRSSSAARSRMWTGWAAGHKCRWREKHLRANGKKCLQKVTEMTKYQIKSGKKDAQTHFLKLLYYVWYFDEF